MATSVLAFINSIADACAEPRFTTIETEGNNAKFLRLVFTSIDDALNHLSTLHQWEWLVRYVNATAPTTTLANLVRVRDVYRNGKKLPYRTYKDYLANVITTPYYTVRGRDVHIVNIPTLATVADTYIEYESYISYSASDNLALIGGEEPDSSLPDEFMQGFREYVLYVVYTRHIKDHKEANTHLQNALAAYDILKAREHSNKNVFNRYTGVNR